MLELKQVSYVYPNGKRALDQVSFSIARGIYGLLGPNGAGKSTLMRIVAALQAPTEGTILFDGIDGRSEPERLYRRLGYLPQNFSLFPHVSASEMLDHMIVLKGVESEAERRAMAGHLLEKVNLWDVRDEDLGSYSDGMRQRFGIAQALVGDPDLIIVDEPTAGLDPEERNRFLSILAEVGDKAVVLLSTHIVEDVSDVCSRMAILADGRVRLEGVPTDLVRKIRDRIWMKIIDRSELEAVKQRYDLISTRLSAGRTIVQILSDDHPGDGFIPADGGLEDVYFSALASSAGPIDSDRP